MAHPQYRGAVELDNSPRSHLDGEIFEMPGDSVVHKAENEPGRKPVQAQDGDVVQANPWPFYLDQDVRTESRVDVEEQKKADVKSEEQQPLANPWAYFGPMSPGEEDGPKASATVGATAVGLGVGGLGIKAEESGHAEAKIEDVTAAPRPLRLSSHGVAAGYSASHPPAPAPSPAVASESSSPPSSFYVAPLRVSRKQVPPVGAAPAFIPYSPPAEDVAPVAPLNVKHQRPSAGPQGDATTTLPYRPYRPAGHVDDVPAASTPPVPPQPLQPASVPPPQSHGPPAVGAVPPHGPSPHVVTPQAFAPPAAPPAASQGISSQPTNAVVSASLDPGQQQPQQQDQRLAADSSGSAEVPLVGVAPQHQHHQQHQPPPPVADVPPPLPPPLPMAAAPPIQAPVPVVAVAEHPPVAAPAPTPYHNSQPPVPLNSSPIPGQPTYAPPHSAPTSSVPSPQMASFQFQPINQGPPQNLYSAPSPTPPVASQAPPSPAPYPPTQHYTPPPPTSGYEIPQPTYASSTVNPPPQPPRPEFQQAAAGAYQQYPQPQPSPTYGYAGAPRPGTQPPPATHPSGYNAPYGGPAIAPHQHQYPTQPTYAAANGNSPSSPNVPQAQYASPPLPPRPATTQPQLFLGFNSQNVVSYPPPPQRVFSPPPAVPGQGPRRSSGGMSSGRLFSSSSALKWIDKTGKGLENKLDAVLGPSNKPPPQPPRPT